MVERIDPTQEMAAFIDGPGGAHVKELSDDRLLASFRAANVMLAEALLNRMDNPITASIPDGMISLTDARSETIGSELAFRASHAKFE